MGGEAEMEWAIRTRHGSCRRKNLRIDVTPPIRVLLRNDDGEFVGVLHDISLGGARISSTSFPSGSGRFNMRHDLSGEILTDVKWCEGSMMGVAFVARRQSGC